MARATSQKKPCGPLDATVPSVSSPTNAQIVKKTMSKRRSDFTSLVFSSAASEVVWVTSVMRHRLEVFALTGREPGSRPARRRLGGRAASLAPGRAGARASTPGRPRESAQEEAEDALERRGAIAVRRIARGHHRHGEALAAAAEQDDLVVD